MKKLYLFKCSFIFYTITFPNIYATIKEKRKAKKFLKKAPFLPIYLVSKGKVTTPTKVKVDTNAAI